MGHFASLGIDYFLFHVGKIFNYNLFKNVLISFLFLFFCDPHNMNVGALDVVPEVSQTILSSLHSFYLFCSSDVISIILSSSSLIHSSASDILLLIPSRVFLISVIVLYVSVCLFFNSSAAAAAKSLQLCPTLCDPIDGSPPGFPVPGFLQARTLEGVAISLSNA